MWTRSLAVAAVAALVPFSVPADSITIDGQVLQDVLVTETGALYYVMFPETGKSAGYAKSKVDPASVVIEPDANRRNALRARFEQTRPPLPEPEEAERPKLIPDPTADDPAGDPAAADQNGAYPEPVTEDQNGAYPEPVAEDLAPRPEMTAPPVSGVTPGGWRQPKLRVGRPGAPVAPFSQPGATAPLAAAPEAGQPEQAASTDPVNVPWTQAAPAETPATDDPAAAGYETMDPALAGAAPLEALPPAPEEVPVVIEHQAFTDENGVKTLVVKGNRQRDPYRDTRIAQRVRAAEAAEAQALAEQQAQMAAAEAAAQQAAYEQWAQEQANWEAYMAEQYNAPPQIVEDQWGLSLQGGGGDPYAALSQLEAYGGTY